MSDSPLWRPGRIGPMELKNRVIRSATNEHLSQPDGQLTTAWMDTLVELAENEVGLVITGHMSVDRQQRSDQGQTVLDEQTDLGLLYETARRVHQAGGRIVAQLNHGGKKAPENVNGHPPKLPADFSLEKLDQIVGKYRYAAMLCRRAGFDGVQIHNAYGYLLASFLNHYSDTLVLTRNGYCVTLSGEGSLYSLAVWQDGTYSYSIRASQACSEETWESILEGMG